MTVLSAFPITPANADGQVDLGALQVLLQRLVAAGVGSIGLLGSTGTYAFLERHQRRRAVEAAVAAAAGRVPILVGVGALRTDAAVRMAQDAKGAGAEAGLLAAMSYTPLTEDEVFVHCETVARESGLPLCLYDNPGTTHFRFTPALVGRLARFRASSRSRARPPSRAGRRRISTRCAPWCRPGSPSATAATGTRSRPCWRAARLGTASSPGCSRSPPWRSSGRSRPGTPPRRSA